MTKVSTSRAATRTKAAPGIIKAASREPVQPQRMQKVRRQNQLQAAYDAAQTTPLNEKYWRNADLLDADAANDPQVRATLRSRARYECLESNSFLKGIVHTLANDTIGRGPRLQVLTPNEKFNAWFEASWASWSKQVRLGQKLRTGRVSKCVDGEVFLQRHTNRRLRHQVQLDYALIEADMITHYFGANDQTVDGIEFDEWGNPTRYYRLKSHPGGTWGAPYQPVGLDANDVIHMFRSERPGQHRGVPEVTTALPLCALLRDYTLATLHSARTAAKLTAVLETAAASVEGDAYDESVQPFDPVDIDYDMITSLPHGWKMSQFKPEQPTTNYQMFRDAIIGEIGRSLNMPFNVSALNSASYNYSSGRLDYQVYDLSIRVERAEWEEHCLDRMLSDFFSECVLLGLVPDDLGTFDELPHVWFWDSRAHVDPAKEAQADEIRLRTGTTTLSEIYAAQGRDWREQARQRVEEEAYILKMRVKHGLSPQAPDSPTPVSHIGPEDDEDPDLDPEERKEAARER